MFWLQRKVHCRHVFYLRLVPKFPNTDGFEYNRWPRAAAFTVLVYLACFNEAEIAIDWDVRLSASKIVAVSRPGSLVLDAIPIES